ncbi:hypothetical protein EDD16DRAFT_1523351 [Pisolithus croceorrhizus]|nr:hypothetical protein EDD16DRAFT_1523351 [Pisolithus croceorrhizus]
MPPTTRLQNKTKHPGLLDLPVVAPAATGPPGSRLQAKQKAKSKPEQDSITRQVAALEVDLLTQQQQARASAHQPPGPPQKKQPCVRSTMYRTKVSSGLEAKNNSDEGGNRKTRKRQPTSGEESEAANERKSRQRKKWKGTTGEEIPTATWGSTVASVQKASKSTVGTRSQVATSSNATEPIVAHTGSNPEAAMTVDNNTMGVDDDLDEANPGKIVSKTQQRVTRIKSNATRAPDVNAMGKEVEGVTTRMAVDNEGKRHVECARPSTVSQLNGKGNSPHEPASRSPRSPFPVIGLVPNWRSTKVHLAVPPQSQPNTKTSNSKAGSQHRTDGSASNPDAAPQDGYKSSYGGLDDGDDANDARAQVPYTNSMHTSRNPFSPRASAFHLTLNGKPTSPLIRLKKPGSISPGHANMESECGYLTIDKHRVGSGEEGRDYDGYRGDNGGSDRDERSDDEDDNDDNDDNDNDDNGSGNNGDAPAPTCTTSRVMEQSRLDARVFKKGSSNSFKPVVRVFNHSLTRKVPSMQQPSQQVQKPGPSQNWASGAPSRTQGHSRRAVEADKENFEILWKLANPLHVAHVQKLWAETFPNIKCTVALRNDPIFALVHPLAFYLVTILIISEVKQHTYDWRSELATRALKAVEAFFDRYEEVDTTKARAAYVAWAVPEVTEIVDAHGRVKPVAPSLFPYMWERVEEGPDGPIPKGAFQHDCILDTFAFYLESTSVIKPSVRENPACFPQCALTLATIAVERAFRAWSTGQYVPLPKAQQRFSQALWGYATNKVMESVDCLSAKQWKRILLGAEKYVGAYRPQPTLDVLVAKLRKPSGRATCFEPDSE